jgi:predicted ATPase/DNA-binding winged helix-turn-helix (wHTH) protein
LPPAPLQSTHLDTQGWWPPSEHFVVSTVYEIGPFRLDPAAGVLTRLGKPIALGARAVAVLTELAKRPNEYLSKEGLLGAAWSGVIVEESNLAVQISSIRRALAQVQGGEHWIETLARRGYRFVGPITELVDNVPRMAIGDARASNLPLPLTSFIGRERELVEIKRLLPQTRLLTLVGTGGIGKTRLAMQVAAEVIAAYRDGAWLADLAPLSDPALVPSAVARVLDVREVAGQSLIETLRSQIKARQLLLLLDNCEHLSQACALLADTMLRGAAQLTIIATSREPLAVAGEQTFSLSALSLPEPAANNETVERSEAVQLFVERAQKQQPGFALTTARARVVAEVCIRLDGIPLALELAAARLRSMSIEQINGRLSDRFRLLTGGTHAALPRQQTLRATLDWSYDLLAEEERAVLRRLAVFAGTFAVEAASRVAADERIDQLAVIDILSQLITRSLVVADTNVADARYRLLETTRAYALEKLADAGEADSVQRQHAQYFRARFEHAADDWLRMRDEDWRAAYLPELDNVRVALDWALGPARDAPTAVALAGSSGPIWVELSLLDEGVQRLEAALALVGLDTPELPEAQLWRALGTLWGDGRALEKAANAHERAADLYRRLDDPLGLGSALVARGRMLAHMGRLEQAASVIKQAYPMLERAGVPVALAGYFNGLGLLMAQMGDPTSARTHFERALSYYESAETEPQVLAMLNNLADMTWMQGDLNGALVASLQAVARMRKSPHAKKSSFGICLVNLAGVCVERGDLAEALNVAQEGLPLLKEFGLVWYPLDHLALRAALAGKVRNAALLVGFSDAAYTTRKMSRQPNEVRAHERLQNILRKNLAPAVLAGLLDEGAALNEEQACVMALEE